VTASHAFEALRRDFATHPARRIPRIRGLVFAAVSIAITPVGDDLRLVLIGRSRREGDRWSGDIAFPGGLSSTDDASGLITARREAREEVGLELGEPLGTLSDRVSLAPGRSIPMRIRPFVFAIEDGATLVADPREVAAIYRPTLTEIDRAERDDVERKLGPWRHRFEGRTIGEHRLWGLTWDLIGELRMRIGRGSAALR